MNEINYTTLQIREAFHLEFLRWLGKRVKVGSYVLKGGVNMRCFYKSVRYSEDMDLDATGISMYTLKETVMNILLAPAFYNGLKAYGIERIVPPDMGKAKQTKTTQRFKLHLITYSKEDLFTKIEFSRRGITGNAVIQTVQEDILRSYKMAPLLVPHYDVFSAVMQKVRALASRSIIQARDVFDLYVLKPQTSHGNTKAPKITKEKIAKAYENIFLISFEQFRDTVIAFLPEDDAAVYNTSAAWDEIQLKVANFLEELKNE